MKSRGIITALHLDITHCPIQKQPVWNNAPLCTSNVVDLFSEGHGSNIRRYTSYPELLHSACLFHEASGGTGPRLRQKSSFPELSNFSLIHHSPYRSTLHIDMCVWISREEAF